MADLGRILIVVGGVLLLVGIALTFLPWIGLGRLPGDIVVRRHNWTLYFPIATSIVLSVVLTLILVVISWIRR